MKHKLHTGCAAKSPTSAIIILFYFYFYLINYAALEALNFLSPAVNKQLNDKERVAAALENPNLRQLVDECLYSSEL